MNGYVGPPPGGPAGGIARLQARWLQGERSILPSGIACAGRPTALRLVRGV